MKSDELNISNLKLINYLKKISRISFAITLTSSFIIIEFILYKFMFQDDQEQQQQSNDGFESSFWYLNVIIITLNLIIIHPLLILILLINKFFKSEILNKNPIKLGTILGIFMTWLIILWNFHNLIKIDIEIDPNSSIISQILLKISIIGITLISVLNGIGSFSTVYYNAYIKLKNYGKIINDKSNESNLKNLRENFENINSLIIKKEDELNQLTSSANDDQDDGVQRRPSLYSKKSFIDVHKLNPFKNQPNLNQDLQTELNSLKTIKNDLYLKINKLEEINQSLQYKPASNHLELMTMFIQYGITIYCFFKIIQVFIVELISIFNSTFRGISTKESDPLVLTIIKILKIFITIEDDFGLINQLSFLISGILFICSINGVWLTFKHFYKFIPIDLTKLNQITTTGDVPNQSVSIIKNLLISELTGIYILATMLILKSNLTQDFNLKLNSLLFINNNETNLIIQLNSWFDKIYLISCGLTFLSIKIGEYLNHDEGFENQDIADKIV
ncbi:putative membrane protein [Wickerhamomyces ciferrii]|uniref:Membrane protein n=1 Tax=Wickerhamomyces ciferrii (strain ATCC 14091 / BCRC 22168 / CBS 111 / JCM 3599 / NBRC 0793 / NRRL Y-1031 F-60-10) TaxID=1206466 RepID=K0KVF7_WICCF|nr:uncharacterized protein BN7_5016 [Wickerhamomyces ciferrii]CCH45434.1 putative membrane protein [Wickerhamomyces ciferrii]